MSYVDNIIVHRIIGPSKTFLEVLPKPIDVKIELDIKDDDKKLHFSITNDYEVREEDYLTCFGGEWVVKEVNRDTLVTSIIAVHNIEKLTNTPVSSIRTESLTLSETLTVFFSSLDTLDLGGNWSYLISTDIVLDVPLSTRRRTIDMRRVMAFDVLKSIADTWFLELSFDTLNKVVIFHKQRGEDKGVYFTSQLNLRKISVESDTYDFVTQIIPIGKDDLNIASVNGGSILVTNFDYSDKALTKYWVDNRYTDPNHLKEDAISKLVELAKPMKTYSCDIIDLSSTTHPILAYGIGDTVTIINEHLGIRDVQRIVKMTVYPYNLEENRAELANRRAKFDELQNQLIDTRDSVSQAMSPSGRIIFNEVEALPEFKQTVETDIDSLTTTVTTMQETLADIDVTAYVVTLGNESQTIPVSEDHKVVGDVDFGTGIYVYLGGSRRPATIGPVQFYSSAGEELSGLTVPYNENNIYNSDFSDDLLPNFNGEQETLGGTTTIGSEFALLASSGAPEARFVIGEYQSTSSYFSDPELPFQAGKQITFSAYLKTGVRPLETAWAVSTLYVVGAKVSHDGQNYECLVEHTSVDLYTDLNMDRWKKIGYAFITIYEWEDNAGVITMTSHPSAPIGIEEEGLVVTNHTVSANAVNIALGIISVESSSGTHSIEFKEPKLEEGSISTTYTPLLDIKNNFEIVHPADDADGSVMTTLLPGTYVPVNVGYLSIPIAVDGVTFLKRISFTRMVTSESALYINIIPSTVIFQSNDGGTTFSPEDIKLYPDLRNIEYVKWQYSYDGYNYTDLPYYLGLLIATDAPWDSLEDVLISPAPAEDPDPFLFEDVEQDPDAAIVYDTDGYSNVLLLRNSSTLFTREVGGQYYPVNSVIFRLVGRADNVDYTDSVTVSKAYDSRETIRTLESTVRTDIESISESVTEFRNDLYYYNSESGRYELYTSDYTRFKQDVNNFMFTVQDGGGANLLKDSVGANYPTSGAWTLLSGAVRAGIATSWGLSYISKRSWFISTGSLKQEFTIQPNTEYTFSCAFKKPLSGTVTFSLKASTWPTPQVMVTKPAGEVFEGATSFTFMSGANTRFEVIMTVSGASSEVEITDVMMSMGKISSWQQSNGELFATNVIIDETGIKVQDVNGQGYTIISPQEFAGYYDGQRIFTLNGTKTIVQELVAAGGGIYVAPVKLIQVEGATPRAAFVWTGPDGE